MVLLTRQRIDALVMFENSKCQNVNNGNNNAYVYMQSKRIKLTEAKVVHGVKESKKNKKFIIVWHLFGAFR